VRYVTFREVGPPNTPQEIKRLRRENMDLCRKMGQPVVFRHMYNLDDVENGEAKKCPACFDSVYEQTRNDCPVCYSFGFVSVEDNPFDVWVTTDGQLVTGAQPNGSIKAPRYGGFANPLLTWLLEPDVAIDVFRVNEQGVMIQTFDAEGVAPWYPRLGDNDLCINVVLDQDGYTITDMHDRFQLKRVQQITMRGLGRRGAQRSGHQPFQVGQSFQMSKAPTNSALYGVPVDSIYFSDLVVNSSKRPVGLTNAHDFGLVTTV